MKKLLLGMMVGVFILIIVGDVWGEYYIWGYGYEGLVDDPGAKRPPIEDRQYEVFKEREGIYKYVQYRKAGKKKEREGLILVRVPVNTRVEILDENRDDPLHLIMVKIQLIDPLYKGAIGYMWNSNIQEEKWSVEMWARDSFLAFYGFYYLEDCYRNGTFLENKCQEYKCIEVLNHRCVEDKEFDNRAIRYYSPEVARFMVANTPKGIPKRENILKYFAEKMIRFWRKGQKEI